MQYFLLLVSYGLAALMLPSICELMMLTVASWFRAPVRNPAASRWPRMAVLIPAHNEELHVERTVNSALALDYPGELAVLVVADNCTDQTAKHAARAGAGVLVRTDAGLRGKGYALDLGFRALLERGYEVITVLDADSVISGDSARVIAGLVQEGAEAVQLRYEVRNQSDSSHTGLMSLAFLAFNVVRPRGRQAMGLSAGIVGNGFALTRETIEAVPYAAFSVVEDLEYHLRLVRSGRRVQFADNARVLGDMPAKRKESKEQRARWEGGRWNVAKNSLAGILREIGGGQFRLIEPALDLVTFPLAALAAGLAALLLVPGPGRLLAVAGLLTMTAHILTAAAAGGQFWSSLRSLAAAPGYVAWKVTLAPALHRMSRQNAPWVRTTRV